MGLQRVRIPENGIDPQSFASDSGIAEIFALLRQENRGMGQPDTFANFVFIANCTRLASAAGVEIEVLAKDESEKTTAPKLGSIIVSNKNDQSIWNIGLSTLYRDLDWKNKPIRSFLRGANFLLNGVIGTLEFGCYQLANAIGSIGSDMTSPPRKNLLNAISRVGTVFLGVPLMAAGSALGGTRMIIDGIVNFSPFNPERNASLKSIGFGLSRTLLPAVFIAAIVTAHLLFPPVALVTALAVTAPLLYSAVSYGIGKANKHSMNKKNPVNSTESSATLHNNTKILMTKIKSFQSDEMNNLLKNEAHLLEQAIDPYFSGKFDSKDKKIQEKYAIICRAVEIIPENTQQSRTLNSIKNEYEKLNIAKIDVASKKSNHHPNRTSTAIMLATTPSRASLVPPDNKAEMPPSDAFTTQIQSKNFLDTSESKNKAALSIDLPETTLTESTHKRPQP